MMITLHQFEMNFGPPNPSPFCVKVECMLRMLQLDYQANYHADMRKAPKGKLPYIEMDGKAVCDSEHIIDHLVAATGNDPDADLTDTQRAVSRAVQAMLDERLYWAMVYGRWIDDRNWPRISEGFFASMPFPANKLVPIIARRKVRGYLHGQGMGRHSAAEIDEIGCRDIRAVAALLGENDYLHGDTPTRVDAVVYSYLCNLAIADFASELREETLRHPALLAYVDRISTRYFAHLDLKPVSA
ncbi:MAG: glutathione S-transferase family protein [Gammaproteobacteria bacterium]|nr:glutathione S-transferase family protein [Gammaproteobacteria bacterium]